MKPQYDTSLTVRCMLIFRCKNVLKSCTLEFMKCSSCYGLIYSTKPLVMDTLQYTKKQK